MAKITVSAWISSTCASSKTGLNRPSASNTDVQCTVRRAVTLPFSPSTAFGPRRLCRKMPSSSPSTTSTSSAGISSRDSRHTTCTSLSPLMRSTERATSNATCSPRSISASASPLLHRLKRTHGRARHVIGHVPPPITTMRRPSGCGVPWLNALRKFHSVVDALRAQRQAAAACDPWATRSPGRSSGNHPPAETGS